jgi:hypothetical protein
LSFATFSRGFYFGFDTGNFAVAFGIKSGLGGGGLRRIGLSAGIFFGNLWL